MKKPILILTALAAISSAQAQSGSGDVGLATNKPTRIHTFMVGSNLLLANVTLQKDNNTYNFAIQPKVGYFLYDNVAVGAALELGLLTKPADQTINYGVTPFVRIFVGKERVREVPRRAKFFLEGGIGIGGANHRYDDAGGNKVTVTTNGPVFYLSPGLDFFLSNNVAFETAFEYRFIGGTPDVNRLGINLGFQIFLNRPELKRIYRDTKTDVDKVKGK